MMMMMMMMMMIIMTITIACLVARRYRYEHKCSTLNTEDNVEVIVRFCLLEATDGIIWR
jgi:hypothetical protein